MEIQTVWIEIQVTLSDEKWAYSAKKKSTQNVQFNLPVHLLSTITLSNLTQELINACLLEYTNTQENENDN